MDEEDIDRLLAALGLEVPEVEGEQEDDECLPEGGAGFDWWGDDIA